MRPPGGTTVSVPDDVDRRGGNMPKYLVTARYSAEGLAGLLAQGGTTRKEAVERAVSEVGGTLECFYFAFGEHDVVSICELPDNNAAAQLSLVVSKSGRAHTTVVPLLSVEDIDAVAASAEPDYLPPGA